MPQGKRNPDWLGPVALKMLKVLNKLYPKADSTLLEMYAESYETWRFSQKELSAFAKSSNKITQGDKAHPAFAVMERSLNQMIKLRKLIGINDDIDDDEEDQERETVQL